MDISSVNIPAYLVIAGIFCVVIALVRITYKEITFSTEKNSKLVGCFGLVLLVCGGISGAVGIYNTPIVTPTEASIVTPIEAPIVTPTEAPIVTPTEATTVTPTETAKYSLRNNLIPFLHCT